MKTTNLELAGFLKAMEIKLTDYYVVKNDQYVRSTEFTFAIDENDPIIEAFRNNEFLKKYIKGMKLVRSISKRAIKDYENIHRQQQLAAIEAL